MRNDLFEDYIDKMNSVRPIIVFISMRIYRVLIYIHIYVYTCIYIRLKTMEDRNKIKNTRFK